MTYTGGCACGAIEYKVEGELTDTTSCHCSQCRKTFSAQASAFGRVGEGAFEWVKGEDKLTSFTNQRGWGIQFCSVCGSTLVGAFNGTVIGVTLGTLNESAGIKLDKHIFVGSKAEWETIPDNAPHFEEWPDNI